MKHLAKLDAPIPEEIAGDLLAKLHYVSTDLAGFAFSSGDRTEIAFSLREGASDRAPTVADQIREVARKMATGYRPVAMKVLAQSLPSRFAFSQDPHPLLVERGELRRFGSGRYALGPLPTSLVEIFDADARALARRFSAPPHQFPSLIGADTLDRCRYFAHFPHSLTFVSHLRENWESIREFAKTARWDGTHLTCAPEWLSEVECLLSPSVCFHYYASLQKSRITDRNITALGKCFRYESGNLCELERLWDFSMREIVFVGSASYVLEERKKSIELARGLLDRWGIAYEIKTATDPFFVDGFAAQATFQAAYDLKFEIRAPLPYKGSTLAVGSFNYHQDYFGRCFEISQTDGNAVHTGCVGFGLERLALAFLAQHGLDPKGWPRAVAERFQP